MQNILALEEKLSKEQYDYSLKSVCAPPWRPCSWSWGPLWLCLPVVNILITRLIAAPIHQTIKTVDKIAEGDLTQESASTPRTRSGNWPSRSTPCA